MVPGLEGFGEPGVSGTVELHSAKLRRFRRAAAGEKTFELATPGTPGVNVIHIFFLLQRCIYTSDFRGRFRSKLVRFFIKHCFLLFFKPASLMRKQAIMVQMLGPGDEPSSSIPKDTKNVEKNRHNIDT